MNNSELSLAALARKRMGDLPPRDVERALKADVTSLLVDCDGETLLDSSPAETKITRTEIRDYPTGNGRRFRFVSFSVDLVIAEQPTDQPDDTDNS